MIPKIYPSGTTDFTKIYGYLPDAISCKVTEERNGAFDLEMEYPLSGSRYDEITEGTIIASSHDDSGEEQPFRVYNIKRDDKTAKIKARHRVQMILQRMPVRPYPRNSQTVSSVMTALNAMSTGWAGHYPSCTVSFATDMSDALNYPKALPRYVLPFIVGADGSIVDMLKKGEVKYSANGINLLNNRGADTGITITYGRNVSEITGETSTGECYTGAFLYYLLDGKIKSSKIYYYNIGSSTIMSDLPNIQEIDITREFAEPPANAAAFATIADPYAAALEAKRPWANLYNNIIVSWQELSSLPEYSYLPSRSIRLCDTVRVVYPAFGLNKTTKVVKTVWDAIAERYDKIELDSLKKPLHGTIRNLVVSTVRRM